MQNPPTARQIDEACRLGLFVYYSNRQKILGATQDLKEHGGQAAPDHVWIHRASDLEWGQVKLSEVVIEERNGETMPQKGKRENGRPGLPSGPTRVSAPKKDAAKQPELPGVEQEKIPAIERAAKKYNELKEPFAEARDNLSSAKDSIMKMMHDKVKPNDAGELVYKRGDIKVTIKPSKEKLKVVIGDDDGESESDIELDEE